MSYTAAMTRQPVLDRLIPAPRLLEIDHVDLAALPEQAWQLVRHGDLARSPLVRALFELRALPERLAGTHQPNSLSIDDFHSTSEAPGFSLLLDEPPRAFAVGAIGKVWHGSIPFVHVEGASSFLDFTEPDFVKVAWSVRVLPQGERDCRVEIEVRVDATDEQAWRKFERYFRIIGPGSHFIRRVFLSGLVRELGTLESAEAHRPLSGDELLPAAGAEATDGVTIGATPERIWPWLVQMGCRRAGFYSVDWLDNGGVESSRELVPELQRLQVGDVVPASTEGDEGFEVLRIEPAHALVLGGLYDTSTKKQLPFGATRPDRFWQVTWAFVLERLDAGSTRLHVRARAAYPEAGTPRVSWIRPVHHFMQRQMLKHLAARAEGRLSPHDYRDVLAGAGGTAVMLAALLTPFWRSSRSHWGVTEDEAGAPHVGDELVADPVWSWTHGVKIDASPELVWHWVAQIGADRGGFYSYQWLENIAGCGLRNADSIHQDWELELGDEVLLHPKVPPLRVVRLERGHHFLALAPLDESARAAGKPWAVASWLFELTPLAEGGCRLVTRYRVACSPDLATRLALGPALLEPVGFAMDRRMLLGIKQHAEQQAHYALGTSRSSVSRSSDTFTGLVR
jgi:hypothetical protein